MDRQIERQTDRQSVRQIENNNNFLYPQKIFNQETALKYLPGQHVSNQNFVGCKWFKPLPRKWNGKEHLKETASHSACAPLIFWNWVFCQVNSAVLKTSRTKQPGQRLVAQSSLDKVYADHPTPLASQWSVGKKNALCFQIGNLQRKEGVLCSLCTPIYLFRKNHIPFCSLSQDNFRCFRYFHLLGLVRPAAPSVIRGLNICEEAFNSLKRKMKKMGKHALYVVLRCPFWIAVVHEENLRRYGQNSSNTSK